MVQQIFGIKIPLEYTTYNLIQYMQHKLDRPRHLIIV